MQWVNLYDNYWIYNMQFYSPHGSPLHVPPHSNMFHHNSPHSLPTISQDMPLLFTTSNFPGRFAGYETRTPRRTPTNLNNHLCYLIIETREGHDPDRIISYCINQMPANVELDVFVLPKKGETKEEMEKLCK
uniref:Uncharacterized protein n=1 Tax=Cacopsylla melanoneura TaxID=428564 RepID=A0A8D8R3A9_9HEMI